MAGAEKWGDFDYETDGASVTITGYTGPGGAVDVPAVIAGLPVTRIGPDAFRGCAALSSVTILDGVTNIGDRAFHSCTSLRDAAIPDSITSFGVATFLDCTGLKSVAIGNGATAIGSWAFMGCTSLTSLKIGQRVTSIGTCAFYGCRCLTNVAIPNSVTTIGTSSFEGCESLTELTIPEGVAAIGSRAFWGCVRLTSVAIPSSVTKVWRGAFSGCTALTDIVVDALNPAYSSLDGVLLSKAQDTLVCYPAGRQGNYVVPDGVTDIGEEAFYGCVGLTSVRIGNRVRAIGDWAFKGCGSLANVTIPGSVTSIGARAFEMCSGVKGFYFQGNAPRSVGCDAFAGLDIATVYYLSGALGWGESFAGRPAVLWDPVIASLGITGNGFNMRITGTAGIPIVLEACSDLASGVWVPVRSTILTTGFLDFTDSGWTNHPSRFFRISSP